MSELEKHAKSWNMYKPPEQADMKTHVDDKVTKTSDWNQNPAEYARIVRIVDQKVKEDTQCYW